MKETVLDEFRIDIGFPIEHADDVVKILMAARRDILHQQFPRHGAALHHGLKNGADIRIHLRLVSDQRTGRMQNPGVDLPACSGAQFVGFRVVEDSVVAFIPALEAAADIVLGRAGFEAHEGVGEIVAEKP